MNYVMGIDVGTSGTKTILVDQNGRLAASATFDHPLYSPRHGWNEQKPEEWMDTVWKSCRAVFKQSDIQPSAVSAVGLSGQMHGLTALDENLKVIRPAILWNDQRSEPQCKKMTEAAGGLEGLLSYTNNRMLPGYQGGKIWWLRENEPENYSKMRHALLPKDYIRYRLTGALTTEVSDASGTGLFDVKNRKWETKLMELYDIDSNLFPPFVESPEFTGKITRQTAEKTGLLPGTPVMGGGGDSVAQTTGMGLIEEGVLGITIGTAGIIAMGTKQYRPNQEGRLQFFCNNEPGLYHVMGVMLAGGGSYQWYRNTLCRGEMLEAEREGRDAYELINKEAEVARPGSGQLIYLPYLSGERCPYSDPNLRACFIGLSQTHTKNELTRSVMEGVSYGLRHIGEQIQALYPDVAMKHIVASGGGVRAAVWRQIISDVFQLPVLTLDAAEEGGAYGAALIAGVGIGMWPNLKTICDQMIVGTETLPDPANKETYDELFDIYKSTYLYMKPLFDRLANS